MTRAASCALLGPNGVYLATIGEAVDAEPRKTVGIEEREKAALEARWRGTLTSIRARALWRIAQSSPAER